MSQPPTSDSDSHVEVRSRGVDPTASTMNGSTVLLGGSGAMEKLEGAANYHSWKFTMKMTFKLEGFWDLIDRSTSTELTGSDAARDQRALARLCLSIKPGLYQYVREAATAKEAWKKLSDVFEDRGLYRRVLLLRQLHRIDYNDHNSMSAYIEKVMSLVHQLSDIGKSIEDEEIAEILLSGLPQEYESLVSNLETLCLSSKLSSELVRTRLLQEAQRKDDSNGNLSSNNTAFISKKQILCRYCGKAGHVKAKCFKLRREKTKKKEKEPSATAYLAHTATEVFLDSGSSNHLVNNKDLLLNIKDTDVQVISAANNQQMTSTCTGDMQVVMNDKGEAHDVCDACLKGKTSAVPVPRASSSQTTQPLQLIHSDVCGPLPEASWGGARYLVSFTDDFTRKSFIYLMKNKSQFRGPITPAATHHLGFYTKLRCIDLWALFSIVSIRCHHRVQHSASCVPMSQRLRGSQIWEVRASTLARNTHNVIREIVENLQVEPNPNKQLIALSIGDPTTFGNLNPPDQVVQAVRDSIELHTSRSYGPGKGHQDVREAVAEYCAHQGPVEADDVILCSGCSHAIEMAVTVLADAGQNILVPRPGFLIYRTLSEGLGIKIKYYNLLPDQQWKVDLEDLENQIDDNTKAIVIINPSNPCGSVYNKEHLIDILEIASRNCVPIIADEIYEHMVFSGNQYHSLSSLSTDVPLLSCGGITKRFLVPGWRMGWVIIHDRNNVFGKEVRKGLNNMTTRILGPNTLIQRALPAILQLTPQTFFDEVLMFLESQAKLAYEALRRIPGLRPVMPQGAMYMMIQIKMGLFPQFKNELQFVERLVSEQSVFCLPGKCFEYPNYMRIVLTVPEGILREACDRITVFCREHVASRDILKEVDNNTVSVAPVEAVIFDEKA